MAGSSRSGTPADNGDAALTFEAALERLRSIVESLERGDLTLDESIARYEEGMRLSRRLTQQLDQAEKRIERLMEASNDADPPTTRPMEVELRGGDAPGGGPLPEGELPF